MEASEAQRAARATWSAGDFDAVANRIWAVGDRPRRAGRGQSGRGRARRRLRHRQRSDPGRRRRRHGDRARHHSGAVRSAAADAQRRPVSRSSGSRATPRSCRSRTRASTSSSRPSAACSPPSATGGDGRSPACCGPAGASASPAGSPEGAIGDFFAHDRHRTLRHRPRAFSRRRCGAMRDHVTALFEGTGVEVRFEPTAVTMQFDSVDEAVEEYSEKFGPIVLLRAALEPQGRWEALRDDSRRFLSSVRTRAGERRTRLRRRPISSRSARRARPRRAPAGSAQGLTDRRLAAAAASSSRRTGVV